MTSFLHSRPLRYLIGSVFCGLLVVLFAPQASAAACDNNSVRWSASSNRVYVGAGAVCNIPEIQAAEPHANILQLEPGDIWQVGSSIILQEGATLNIQSPEVRELRLVSNNTGSANDNVYLRAQWGTINIRDTSVTSWDEALGGPDTEYATYGRSHIQVKSFLEGDTPRESRLDIVNSDIGYLGYYGAEAYGLSWKVLGNTPGIYDQVNVYGDITNSRIHHNYFGVYSFGLFGGQWIGNQVHDNVVYGLDPHDDSDSILIAENNVYGNGSHGIICSQRCDHLTIRDNQSHDNGGNGIMLHRDTNDSLVVNNILTNNLDSGIALFASHRNTIQGNEAKGNGNGIRLSVGSSDNVIKDNIFTGSKKYGIYFYKGSDLPVNGDGRPKNNQFTNNTIADSVVNGLKLKEGDGNIFTGNTFTKNGKDNLVDEAHGNQFTNNTISLNTSAGLRFINGSHDNTVNNNELFNNGKNGLLVENSSGNQIQDNHISKHSQSGVQLIAASNNNLSSNGLAGNTIGVYLKNLSNNNQFSNNNISNSGKYAISVQDSNNNIFTADQYADVATNGVYATSKSQNTIIDSLPVWLKVGDSASRWTMINHNNAVFLYTGYNVTTHLAADQSDTILSSGITRSLARYADSKLAATASAGEAVIELNKAFNPPSKTVWKTKSLGAALVDYDLGGLISGQTYQVKKNGGVITTIVASPDGHLQFNDSASTTLFDNYEIKAL